MSAKSKSKSVRSQAAGKPVAEADLCSVVRAVMDSTEFVDIHTHLYPPSFGGIGLWGIDELLTYHYLEAEFFRYSKTTPDEYWRLSKQQQADAIWKTLFIDATPVSEATRGVIKVLESFGLPTKSHDLAKARAFFKSQKIEAHLEKVLRIAGVRTVVMTNDPLDPAEAAVWHKGIKGHAQFRAVLRLDRILCMWEQHWPVLVSQGYQVDEHASGKSALEVRRFLSEWCERMKPVYMAVSLPHTFHYPEDTVNNRLLRDAVLPVCHDRSLPLSLMIGVRRQVNPAIRLAGDAVGRADLAALENLCREFSENRFLVSVLSRENQHELCVYARKFSNLLPFGCWWFLNNPSIVEEITRERIEMLGLSFIPQHSDARVLEQVIYKWHNTRRTVARVLAESYRLLLQDGGRVTKADIQGDVARLFCGNAEEWIGS